jgi:glycosyltransferase involved in cell wall biosynthesis
MKLVVIIPALNEAATIAGIIRRIPARIRGVSGSEVIVVDDGSSDATGEQAGAAGARVVRHPVNRGVGAAFKTGVAAALDAGADLVVNMDADGQFRPEDIPRLIAPILGGRAGFVTCTRFADPAYRPQMPWVKRWGNTGMTWLISRLCGRKFTDVSCGFRAYSRETLLRLNLYGRFTYTQEMFLNLAVQDVAMAEVALPVRGTREFGQSRVAGSIAKYVRKTVPIIFRTLRDVRPLAFFGAIAAVLLVGGLAVEGFVFGHWWFTGRTHPYQALITLGAVGIILGFLVLVIALLADMLNRLRRLLETVLYYARREHYGRGAVHLERLRGEPAEIICDASLPVDSVAPHQDGEAELLPLEKST